MLVPRLLNVTVPVGVPAPGDTTDTWAVRDVPFVAALKVVVVLALLTMVVIWFWLAA
jgi:hypothetical protein